MTEGEEGADVARFSVRYGFLKDIVELGFDEMPASLRNGLWDTLRSFAFRNIKTASAISHTTTYSRSFRALTMKIWTEFFRYSADDIPSDPDIALKEVKQWFFRAPFHGVYDLIEFVLRVPYPLQMGVSLNDLVAQCNRILERERAQCRVIGNSVLRITSKDEITAIEEAIDAKVPPSIRSHISRAAELLSEGDLRNSVKESISAVEAAVALIAGEKPGGVSRPLQPLLKQLDIHPALVQAFEKIFAYTSDESGVRHSLFGEANVSYDDAKFLLIACSAFSNYLLAKSAAGNSQ